MPTGRTSGPPDHPPPRSHARVVRTESLKSERSDKRVSFNKDVGVKRIPRGHKGQPVRASPLPPQDEWANCSQVHREPVQLSSRELEQEAEELVKLIDYVNCDAKSNSDYTRSLDRSRSRRKNNNSNNNNSLAHHTYNNVLFNNTRNNKNTNVINAETPHRGPRTLPSSRTNNPISRRVKGDVNRGQQASPRPLPNGGPLTHRHRSVDHLPDSDLDSPPVTRRAHHLAGHKSVPDLNTVYYNNREAAEYEYQRNSRDLGNDLVTGFKSVDNLYDADHPPAGLSGGRHETLNYKSVDNLADSSVTGRRIHGFKSVGHLPSASLSDSDDQVMSRPGPYRPRVGNIIKKFNQEAEETRRQTVDVAPVEMDPAQRGTLEPDRYRSHNNNQPFSYTGATPLASVQAVRRLSPPRDTLRRTPPRDSPPRDTPVYAQVNKKDLRTSNGRRETERNHQNTRQEREYSAKIIITDTDYPFREGYEEETPYPDTHNTRYDEDDDAYESYQVPEDNLRRLIHENLEEYKEHSNNNINMSSVGVQTEGLPKAPSRSRSKTQQQKSPGVSPVRQTTRQPTQRNQTYRQQTYGGQREQRSQTNIHNNLTSATLVRQVNHGFGRMDRSPSPPPRVSASRQPRRNVVPLLSDTSDSEAEHRRRSVDPLARIRDQVMQREKLQEEEEEEEVRPRRLQDTGGVIPYRSEEMTPLTIDEVDALSLVVEDDIANTGRKSLVVSNQAQSSSITRVSNHRSRRSETVTERVHTQERPKDSLPRPQKPPRDGRDNIRSSRDNLRDKNNLSREATPTRRGRDTPTGRGRETPTGRRDRETPTPKDPPRKDPATTTADKNKNNLEKNKKNNLEKERATKAARHKEEKKKKKRIKIKFFYDPRPQDDPGVDPLSRFTEFKGTSSDERSSPHNDRREDPDQLKDDPHDDQEEWQEELKDEYRRERTERSTVQRDDYHSRRHSEEREILDDYQQQRRGLPDVLEDTEPLTERRKGSREHLDKRNNREWSYDSYEFKGREGKESRDNRTRDNSRSRSRDNLAYDGPERLEGYDEDDERGSPDGGQGRRSLSEKYRSGPLYDPPDDESHSPAQEQYPPTEEEEKREKITRQRNKFLSALRSDGRTSTTTTTTATKSKRAKNSNLPPPSGAKGGKKAAVPYSPTPTPPGGQPRTSAATDKAKNEAPHKKKPVKKKGRAWPWVALFGRRGGGRGGTAPHEAPQGGTPSSRAGGPSSRVSSRASSRASSRSSHRPRRPSVRASKIRRDGQPTWFSRDRKEDVEEDDSSPQPRHWESSTLNRAELRARKDTSSHQRGESQGYSTTQRSPRKYSAQSSASSNNPPPAQVPRTTSFKHRYFGDTDIESNHGGVSGVADYRSLPNRASRSTHKAATSGKGRRPASSPRGLSPPVVGSAGSSLVHSSESEVDSHGGSHASRASKASKVSTGSNRSVYLHATAVADIPVRRGADEVPSERSERVNRQSKKVSRSFSLLAPWKPRHYRERFEVDYDNNREVRESPQREQPKSALPPRPPRKPSNEDKKVNRSQSVYKDSRLATWLRRRKNKEAKGI